MSHTFDRRSFLAGGVALGAGAVILGSGAEWAGAALTNGPGLNGVSTAKPKRGGSLVMGIDTEEGGFDPTSARWDEGGFLYGRTVFDPIAVVNSAGKVEPYLAQSITHNTDYTAWTINAATGDRVPRRDPTRRQRAAPEFDEAGRLPSGRAGLRRPHRKLFGHRAPCRDHQHESAVGPV